MKLSSDPRLLAAVTSVIEHYGELGGLEADERAAFASAAEETCRDTFTLLTSPEAKLDVRVDIFSDRIEVAIEHQGQAVPTAGLETFAFLGAAHAGAGGLSGLDLLSRVDRVQYDSRDGTQRMTLIKHLPARPTGA